MSEAATPTPAPPGPADGRPDGGPGRVRRTALHAAHVRSGAKLVPFGGWEMPLAYPGGTVHEHKRCRSVAVAFDVSHLGTVRLDADGARGRLQETLTNDLDRIEPGRAQYTHLLDDDGGVVDDLIVWWHPDGAFDVMPNASNTSRVRAALGGTDTTDERCVVAVQGPAARALLAPVAPDAAVVGRFQVRPFSWHGAVCTAAGTGYTGEDGVECAVPAAVAPAFWDAVLGAGIEPAGLGARDTLRLEAALPLHGHELGPGITPLQAGLGWVVGWDKPAFRGRDALVAERDEGPRRRLRGLATEGRQPPREEAEVRATGSGGKVGTVTSGNFSPMLGHGVALALLDTAAPGGDGDHGDGDGASLRIVQRGRELPARVVATPFVTPGQFAGVAS